MILAAERLDQDRAVDAVPHEELSLKGLMALQQELDQASLEQVVGDLLSVGQIEALLARRDQILDHVTPAVSEAGP